LKSFHFACLFVVFISTMMLAQSNPVPPINQSAKIVLPSTAYEADPKARTRVLDQHGKVPVVFETIPTSLTVGPEIANNGIPYAVQVTDDGNTLLLASFDSCVNNCGDVTASDGGLYAYSLTTPASPLLEGHVYQIYPPYKWAGYYSLAYSSTVNSAFIADSGGFLQSFDISNPESPIFESGASICCQGVSLVLSLDGVSAFIADAGDNISQFNISNPNDMTLTSSIPLNGEQIWYMAISPDGEQLLAFNQGYVATIDISSGTLGAITVISQTPVLGGSMFGNGTYVGNRTVALVGPTGVTIVDITTPDAPAIVGTLSIPNQQSLGLLDYAAMYIKTAGLTYLVANNTFYVINTF
jgi:hypothetical protein